MIYPSQASDFDEESIKGITTSRDLRTLSPELVKRFARLSTAFSERNPGKTLLVSCCYRSPSEQQRLFQIGRNGNKGPIVTTLDGITHKSRHNKFPAEAVDICVLNGGKPVWDEEHYWPLGALAREFNLEWGGFWTKFQDICHLELPKGEV